MSSAILLVEDDRVQQHLIGGLLERKLGYRVAVAGDGREALRLLDSHNLGDIQAVLLDMGLPGMDGYEVLTHLRRHRPDLPVVVLTAKDDTALAVRAMKLGASDFLIKPADPALLDAALGNAIRLSALSRELVRLKRDRAGALGFGDLIGGEGGLRETVTLARKAAASDVGVLITGQTSTGKELLARTIHGESRRVGGPFVALNCSAIAPEALGPVLFGHERKPGQTALLSQLGKFREAERGTLFLDDVHALTPEAQVKLLRVLQEKVVEPIGAAQPVRVNARVIAATDQDLQALVRQGKFREDLYFRLDILGIAMPALHQRPADIVPLAQYFLQRIAMADALTLRGLTPDARRYLQDHPWPGNIRELEAVLHRALVVCEKPQIDRALLRRIHADRALPSGDVRHVCGPVLALRDANGLFKTHEAVEWELMQAALGHHGGNVTQAATAIGMAKSTFYRKYAHYAPAATPE